MKSFFVKLTALAFLFVGLSAEVSNAAQKAPYVLTSPDGSVKVTVFTDGGLFYTLEVDGMLCMDRSQLSLTLADGTIYGAPAEKVKKVWRTPIDNTDSTVLYRRAAVRDRCNLMSVEFKKFNVEFRAYDDAFAYRFVSKSSKAFTVTSECASFNFAKPWPAYVGYVNQHDETLEGQFYSSFENVYKHHALNAWDKTHLAFSPMLVEADGNLRLALTESDVLDYPGMYLYGDGETSGVKGVFAPYPKKTEQGGHRMLQDEVKERENFLASYSIEKVKAAHQRLCFPWRIVAIARNDASLLANDIVYKLASKPEGDFSWVKPGKVSWEWWNSWNLRGVDFKAGINNDTYKHYIDFAARYGVEYVLFDEGWATDYKNDLFDVVPSLDLPLLCAYAESKGVGVILWAGFRAFNKDMDAICSHYSKMGVKGWKIDFMDRDDQQMVQFTVKAAQTAAKYRQIIDFHGVSKPAGLTRTMPNVINYEAVYGLEQMKFEKNQNKVERDQVVYDVTIPYLRLLAGPADYTQGAMRNAAKSNIRFVYSEPMSPGTRCRQLAEYVIFDAPLSMMCDSPSNYMDNEECTRLIVSVPTVWDEMRAIDGKVAQYAVEARRSGDDWWVAGLTDWTERDWTIDVSSLGPGPWKVELFCDGINADRNAVDYIRKEFVLDTGSCFSVHLAPGGGFIARLSR